MTASDAGRPDARSPMETPVPPAPVEATVRPLPRLGRGVVWSDIVAEIEHDLQERMRDAA
ncbi:DUF6222 family protein [Amycolatopsis sp. NPDC049252]|uniref:DUF6222 family protein n=1 Tax=Amycolatopsis sp. NPDC049252 TaxID=3363933 RepID=UPI003716237A